jgi:hypothetical protein
MFKISEGFFEVRDLSSHTAISEDASLRECYAMSTGKISTGVTKRLIFSMFMSQESLTTEFYLLFSDYYYYYYYYVMHTAGTM